MVRINMEVRYANSMEGCPEYYEASKEEIVREMVLNGIQSAVGQFPKLALTPYTITPCKKWNELKGKLYWMKEDPNQEFYDICCVIKKKINQPSSEIMPIYLSLPKHTDLPEIVVNFYEE